MYGGDISPYTRFHETFSWILSGLARALDEGKSLLFFSVIRPKRWGYGTTTPKVGVRVFLVPP